MKVLTKRQILLLHSALIRQSGGSDGIRDEGLLDSAVSTPFQTFADQELYPSLLEKAARLRREHWTITVCWAGCKNTWSKAAFFTPQNLRERP